MHRFQAIGLTLAALLIALLAGQPTPGLAAAGARSFVITCAPNHYANVDPLTGATNSHMHEFFGNSQAWPAVTTAQMTAYVANVNTVTITHAQTGGQATVQLNFDLPNGVTANPFKLLPVADKVYVSGVDNNGIDDVDVNSVHAPSGVWTLTALPSASSLKFKIATNPPSGVDSLTGDNETVGLSIAKTANVPDNYAPTQADLPRLMSCGKPRGALTYDSAAYWVPAAFQSDLTTHIKPARAKAYYFVTDGCAYYGTQYGQCHAFPQGLILVAGNKTAANGPSNPNLRWSCGHSGTFDTPDTSWLPYNCEPYLAAANLILGGSQSIVDGPIAKVEFPSCGSSLNSTSYSDYTYPDGTGACPTEYRYKFPKLDFRTHLGTAWTGTQNPCYPNACDGWNIAKVTAISGGVAVYTWAYAFDSTGSPCITPGVGSCVAYAPLNLTAPALVSINGQNSNYNNTPTIPTWTATNVQKATCQIVAGACAYSFDIIDPNIVSMSCDPAGVPPTVTLEPCGVAVEAGAMRQFRIAGGDPGSIDQAHFYYTFHADFWNSWHDTTHLDSTKGALTKLVNDCLNPPSNCLPGDIDTNEQLNNLP